MMGNTTEKYGLAKSQGAHDAAIWRASQEGDLFTLRGLLLSGADPNTSMAGCSAVFIAACNGHCECVAALLAANANVHHKLVFWRGGRRQWISVTAAAVAKRQTRCAELLQANGGQVISEYW